MKRNKYKKYRAQNRRKVKDIKQKRELEVEVPKK